MLYFIFLVHYSVIMNDNQSDSQQNDGNGIQDTATPVRRVRIKFIDCGVQGNKYLFIVASNNDLFTDNLLHDTLVG